jgi:hypothetical protein
MRIMNAVVGHAPTTRRLFIPKSQHGITSTGDAFLCSVNRDIGDQHALAAAMRGTTPLPLIDALRRSQSSAPARPT